MRGVAADDHALSPRPTPESFGGATGNHTGRSAFVETLRQPAANPETAAVATGEPGQGTGRNAKPKLRRTELDGSQRLEETS